MKFKNYYYKISVPREENKVTNNFCLKEKDIYNCRHDWLFSQTVNGKKITKILDRNYVLKHAYPKRIIKINEETGKRTIINFFLISLEDILNY